MTIKDFEELVINELKEVINSIIKDNLTLNISANSRAGAEISDWIEGEFITSTNNHKYFQNSESAPKENTKNPWDSRTKFKLNQIEEEIWIDFKAIKITNKDSNPDIGTPDKIVDFILNGNFYYVFIYIFYESTSTGLKFMQSNNSFSKIYFLKDISSKVRRNTKNQLQVNISDLPEYRTREEFINLFIQKINEGLKRQVKLAEDRLGKINETKKQIIKANKKSEKKLTKNLL